MSILVAQIHNLTGGTKRTRELYEMGVVQALAAVNSPEFKEAVLNFEWVDPETGNKRITFKNDFYSYVSASGGKELITKTVTRQKLYSLIMSGWDKFNQVEDGDIDLDATIFYNRWSSAIGYTYKNTFKTWLNTKFWTGSEQDIVAMIAGNIMHEYMHNLGFSHAFEWNSTREFTVPYAIGRIVNRIVKGSYTPGPETFKKVCSRSWRSLWIKKTCKWVRDE